MDGREAMRLAGWNRAQVQSVCKRWNLEVWNLEWWFNTTATKYHSMPLLLARPRARGASPVVSCPVLSLSLRLRVREASEASDRADQITSPRATSIAACQTSARANEEKLKGRRGQGEGRHKGTGKAERDDQGVDWSFTGSISDRGLRPL